MTGDSSLFRATALLERDDTHGVTANLLLGVSTRHASKSCLSRFQEGEGAPVWCQTDDPTYAAACNKLSVQRSVLRKKNCQGDFIGPAVEPENSGLKYQCPAYLSHP